MRLMTRFTAALLTLSAGYAIAASQSQQIITLTSTGVIPTASGTASTAVKQKGGAVDQSLVVEAAGLQASAVFLVKVDGKLAGALNTDGSGAAGLELGTDPKRCENPMPASINVSTLSLVEVQNEAGAVVLTGMF